MNKGILSILKFSVFLAVPVFALAQSRVRFGEDTSNELYGPRAGNFEFTIGGNGTSNQDFDDSFGGVNFSLGRYLTRTQEVLIRQSANYSNPQNGGRAWNASTLLAFDQFLVPNGPVRPYVGVNAGRIYGNSVRDTWAAGLETGVKYYVLPQTFIELTAQYSWYFQHGRDLDDRFDTGQWNWGLGLGFNF